MSMGVPGRLVSHPEKDPHLSTGCGVRHQEVDGIPRPAGPPALADRAPDRRPPRRRTARHAEDGVALGDIELLVLEIVDRELANVADVTRSVVIDGDVSTFAGRRRLFWIPRRTTATDLWAAESGSV